MSLFIKENDFFDRIYNSIEMRINFYETGNVVSSRKEVYKTKNKKIIKKLPKLNDETKQTISILRDIQIMCKNKAIF